MCNYYYPSWPVWPSYYPRIFHYLPLRIFRYHNSTGNDSFYFLLPSGQIIKRTILSISPIEKYKWKVQFIDSQEIVIINNKKTI